jgi:hypothetical protein
MVKRENGEKGKKAVKCLSASFLFASSPFALFPFSLYPQGAELKRREVLCHVYH